MPTKTLIQKYSNVLGQMEQDAMQNVTDAHKDLGQKREDLKFANGELKKLNDVMEDNHRGFWGAAKAIIKMIFNRPNNPAEIEHVLIPIINFKNALESAPAAKRVCEAAQRSERVSLAECTKAERLLNMIRDMKEL